MLLLPASHVGRHSKRQKAVIAWWLLKVSRICGISLRCHGQASGVPTLFVANHVSWLDICILGGLSGACFLSKSEVRRWPVIGWLSWRAGTVFIDRGGKGAAEQAMGQLVFRLRHGDSVILFPEGTTTDGSYVRKFHPRLFGAAQLTRSAVQPVAVEYGNQNGGPSVAAFVGDQSLASNAWILLGNRTTSCVVRFLPVIYPAEMERRELASRARLAIVEGLTAVESTVRLSA